MNRIKLQLYAIELCALLLLLCMFVLSFQRVQALAEEKQEIYLENALSQAAQGVDRAVDGNGLVIQPALRDGLIADCFCGFAGDELHISQSFLFVFARRASE